MHRLQYTIKKSKLCKALTAFGRITVFGFDPNFGKCPRIDQVGSNCLSQSPGKIDQQNRLRTVRPHGNKPTILVVFKLPQHDTGLMMSSEKCKGRASG